MKEKCAPTSRELLERCIKLGLERAREWTMQNQGAGDIGAVLQERGSRYGSFDTHAQITQDLKDVMKKTPNWTKLSPAQKEALEMTAHKVGRILNGDPAYKDSWIDIQGYIKLVSDTLKD